MSVLVCQKGEQPRVSAVLAVLKDRIPGGSGGRTSHRGVSAPLVVAAPRWTDVTTGTTARAQCHAACSYACARACCVPCYKRVARVLSARHCEHRRLPPHPNRNELAWRPTRAGKSRKTATTRLAAGLTVLVRLPPNFLHTAQRGGNTAPQKGTREGGGQGAMRLKIR